MSEETVGVADKKMNWCKTCLMTLCIEKQGDVFCRYCGSKLACEEEAVCECGRALKTFDSFCPHCGRKSKERL